jgi:FdhE protein
LGGPQALPEHIIKKRDRSLKKRKSDNSTEKIKKRLAVMVMERPSHKQVLEFFGKVITEQYKIRPKFKTIPIDIDKESLKVRIKEGFPLVDKSDLKIDFASATKLFRRLCKVLSRSKKATPDAERIDLALRNKHIDLTELFKQSCVGNDEYITEVSKKLGLKDGVLSFLAQSSIKPIFEAYASELKNYVDQEHWWRGYCPICGSEPFMAELKNEGGVEGGRFLVCSICSYEWRFTRLKCPFCENDDHEKLRYFYTEKEGRAYRVDVCEKCKRYIKAVNTAELGIDFIPLIEDIGTLHLDILAQKEGYTKQGRTSGIATDA